MTEASFAPRGIRAILLDIEGTISPLSFVQDVLFPYARRKIPGFLAGAARQASPPPALEQMAREEGADGFSAWCPFPWSPEAAGWAASQALRLMDRDAKQTGLKTLQGQVWEAGYREDGLVAPMFADVPPALRRWKEAGRRIRVYSSGSVAAQGLFFAYSDAGDLRGWIDGWYDTTIGGKRFAASYQTILADWGVGPGECLFLSDVAEELQAAGLAGMATALVLRPGNRPAPAWEGRRVCSFEEVDALLGG